MPVVIRGVCDHAENGFVDLHLTTVHNLHDDAGTAFIRDFPMKGKRRAAKPGVLHIDYAHLSEVGPNLGDRLKRRE
jgi:hypothetical protein